MEKTVIEVFVDKRTRCAYGARLLAWAEAFKNRPSSKGAGLIKYKDDPEVLDYYKKCQDELERMKKHKFEGTLVSYFTFLKKSTLVELPGFVRNDDIVKELETKHHETIYPIYGDFLTQKYEDAVTRKNNMEKVCTILSEAMQFAGPDHEAFKIIFNHLSAKDINLIVNNP